MRGTGLTGNSGCDREAVLREAGGDDDDTGGALEVAEGDCEGFEGDVAQAEG